VEQHRVSPRLIALAAAGAGAVVASLLLALSLTPTLQDATAARWPSSARLCMASKITVSFDPVAGVTVKTKRGQILVRATRAGGSISRTCATSKRYGVSRNLLSKTRNARAVVSCTSTGRFYIDVAPIRSNAGRIIGTRVYISGYSVPVAAEADLMGRRS
jgi:hypothetical protein